ncbi:MAG: FAD-binding oxidoreductase [Candidatus Hydrogenedentes bacterium]|nr:FAD-binding oxidoreductase [Candidatus Hydrogenedentota bacterium]
MPSFVKQRIAGWGGWPRVECAVYRPEKRRGIAEILADTDQPHFIARGLGRSYGDVSVNPGGGVINTTRLNRMIAFDEKAGVLDCEAGVSLEEILETFVPRGWFLPVTPGTKFVTVGGAIANDVHGKNHHVDGSFGEHVNRFTLLTPTGMLLNCSARENEDVFWATIGGIGLTGIILTATIRLQPISSAYIKVDYRQCANIDAALTAIRETDDQYKYSVAWVDCLSKGKKLGRSVLMSGDHIAGKDLPAQYGHALTIPRKLKKNVPFNLPGFLLNSLSIGAFNSLFYAIHPSKQGLIIDYDKYFYPLDAIHNWNRGYGKDGFAQYQATFPHDGVEGLVKLLEKLSESGRASFLAVLKRMGPGSKGMLSHPIDGWTLTLDIPVKSGLIPFLTECDDLVVKHGGRLYTAKDATTRAEVFAAMYPRLDEFKAIKAKLDPSGKLSSRLARRCGIVDGPIEP